METFHLSVYVSGIRRLLFTLAKAELIAIRSRYKEQVPAPLTQPFMDWVAKKEAIVCLSKKEEIRLAFFPQVDKINNIISKIVRSFRLQANMD